MLDKEYANNPVTQEKNFVNAIHYVEFEFKVFIDESYPLGKLESQMDWLSERNKNIEKERKKNKKRR